MKALLTLLVLVLASLAIPSSSAALPVQCSLGPTTPGGDTDCRAWTKDCEAHTHIYDQEDALNVYEASCHDCGVRIGGGPFVRCDLLETASPPAIEAAAPKLPIETHCWSAEFGSGCSTTVTTAAAICTYSSWTSNEGQTSSDVACSNNDVGHCQVGLSPVQNPPSVWCEDYGPPGDSSAASADPTRICTPGFAQTWCDVTIGPCDVRVTPWTAWGDIWARADCQGGGAGPTCHTEVHTQDLTNPEHWCAW